jgi:HlyD family secretion protein
LLTACGGPAAWGILAVNTAQGVSAPRPEEKRLDLQRLRIRGGDGRLRPSSSAAVVAGLAGLTLGLAIGRGCWSRDRGQPMAVDTAVVRAHAGDAVSAFTAGGWIEVAAPAYPVVVSAQVPEVLAAIRVKEGDLVDRGAVLAELYAVNVSNRLEEARAKERAAEAEAARLSAGYRVEEVQAARARLAEAQEAERLALATVERNRRVPAGGLSAEQADADESALRRATAQREQAAAEAARLQAGYRAEEVAAGRARLAEARAARQRAELDLGYCTLRAPAAEGVLRVLRVYRRPGEWVEPKDAAVVSLYDPTALQVRADVTQSRIRGVRAGGPVTVRTEADRQREYAGTVVRAEPLADLAKNTITVRARIDEPDLLLFPEMAAQISFLPAADPDASRRLIVPETAVVRDGEEAHVFVYERGQARKRTIAADAAENGWVTVREGVANGQRVIVSRTADLTDGQRVSLARGGANGQP